MVILKLPVSSTHGNCLCCSWSSSIVEIMLVMSSLNKKGPSPPILLPLHVSSSPSSPATRVRRLSSCLRPTARIPFPASLSPSPHVPLCARGLDHPSCSISSPCPCSTTAPAVAPSVLAGAAGGDNQRRTHPHRCQLPHQHQGISVLTSVKHFTSSS